MLRSVYALLLAAAASAFSISCKQLPVEVPDVNIPVFALNCPGVTPHFANVDTVLIIGHRGAPMQEVENTIASFERAMYEGANAIELDFCMTADGHIVVWHDWNPNDAIALAREGGGESGSKFRPRFPPVGSDLRRPVHELTLEQFRANYWYATKNVIDKQRVEVEIPTFDQFMDWAQQQSGLYAVFFDMKIPKDQPELGRRMIATMDSIVKARNVSWRHVFMTPHQTIWQVIAGLLDGAGLSLDIDLGGGMAPDDYCATASSSYARQRGGGFATTMHPFVWTESPWTTLKNLLLCDLQTRDNGDGSRLVEKVIAATIDDPEKMECLINMGVDGLITNQPSLMKYVAQKLGKKV